MDISLITSLYRTEHYLGSFLLHLFEVIARVNAAGYSMESIIVVNDVTQQERKLLDSIPADLVEHIRVLYVGRETLYASWNRGVALAQGTSIGFWNVDDMRTPEGLVEAHRCIRSGAKIYYAPYKIQSAVKYFGISDQQYVRVHEPPEFDRAVFTRYPIAGPFFMFSGAAYKEVGSFDERFRILGDFEWWVRAAEQADFTRGRAISGTFLFHGVNLSMSRQHALGEENIVHLLHGNYDRLKWMDPGILRSMLEEWQSDVPEMPVEIYESRIGNAAKRRWRRQAWRRAIAPPSVVSMVHLLINRTGLRRLLHRLGIVTSKYPY